MQCAETARKEKFGVVTHIALVAATPFYGPRGWVQWPGNEDYSFQFMQILGAAQDGGSTISECFRAASSINPGDDESWYREWKKLADTSKERGDTAFHSGHTETALSNWLRAMNYFRAAQTFLGTNDRRRSAAIAHMQACSQLYLRAASVGETVEIPWAENEVLQGYFLPAPQRGGASPTVICFGGPDRFKEEYLHSLPRYAHRRGLSLLLVDLPGYRPGALSDDGAPGRFDIETAISGCMDHLIANDGVDPERIAVFGDGLGAALATRGASLDHRFAAVVCDGGIWDLHERAFLTVNIASGGCGGTAGFDKLCGGSIAKNIRCPILVTIGEHDWLDAGHVTGCCQALRASGLDIDLKIFTAAETAAGPGHVDNPTIGNEFIFDWIADRLRGPAA
ncbi:alpha/beta hydrolase family protein [Rhodopseudomonas sp. RCAM05734]|uniref:alpha/beta hydrolase family protein n=1 Tax=Rhodopseudomonas sp. RCAM05734 TaxID=3457549 RepID=UPI0040442670